MKKPTKEDARIMLQLEELLLMEPNQIAMHWFWRMFNPQKLASREEIRKAYPANSEGQRYFDRISAFWESAGTLVKNDLLNERLFFDRFLVKPYWDALKQVIFSDREETNEPRVGENFEWLAMREETWRNAGLRRSKTKTTGK
ncbi:MAG: hypothetical protein ABSF82_03145 [Candidatus Bathyarchaeia archaeon]